MTDKNSICFLSYIYSMFVYVHQLITAFEKAMVLMDPIPGEEHRKVSADYIKCLSTVSLLSLVPVLYHKHLRMIRKCNVLM